MEYKKVKSEINNIVNDNVKMLAQLFPTAVKDGEVDFEALKEELGQFKEVGSEKYELTWAGKQNAKKIAQEDVVGKTLKFIPDDSKNADTTQNIYIEGDNLEVLKLLSQNYYGAIKMIYIDPPYNTGNDFVYNDSYSMNKVDSELVEGKIDDLGERFSVNIKSQNRYHANWLNMMYSRIKLAKELLTPDGLIFISINNIELENLMRICIEIFGEERFIENIIWKNKYGAGGGTNGFANIHEYILVYSKEELISLEANLSEEQMDSYKQQDEYFAQRGGYVTQPLATSSKGERANLMYSIFHEGKEIKPPKGGRWIWSKEKFDEAYAKNGIVINETKTGFSVRFKQYLKDEEGNIRKGKPLSIKSDIFNQEGTKEITELLGNRNVFEFPKPVGLIKYLLSLIVNENSNKDYTVLDFFSGSGSTADAIMQLNCDDGGKRNYICVQIPEKISEDSDSYKEGYHSICDIGKERIRKAGNKILEAHPEMVDKLDVGFKVFKVENTNIKWNLVNETIGQITTDTVSYTPDLIDFVFGAKDIDIVYELMLRQRDVSLSASLDRLIDIGLRTYLYASSYLVCLETEIEEVLVDKLAELNPLPIKFIFRDSAFQDNIALKDETFRRLKALIEKNSGSSKKTYTVEFI